MPLVRHRPLRAGSWTIFLAALACFLALIAWRGRLSHIDEIFYKAAGYHWASRGTFAAPELTGRLPWDPPIESVFACYPPLYPFTFGLYTSVVGFGWRQVAMFDALIHAALCLATAGLVLRMFRLNRETSAPQSTEVSPWVPHVLACLAGMLVLPLGTIGRPDELAMLIAIAAFAVVTSHLRSPWWQVAAGVLWGLCAAASIATAVIAAPIVAAAAIARHGFRPRRFGDAAVLAAFAFFVFAACWIPLLLIHPQALQQFIAHSVDNQHHYFTWLEAWLWAWRASTQLVLTMVGLSVSGILLGLLCQRNGLLRQWALLVGSAMLGLVITLILGKGKGGYLWFVGPWMLAAIVVLLTAWWHQSQARRGVRVMVAGIVVAPMLLASLASSTGQLKQWAAVAAMPSGQTLADAEQALDRSIPDGAVVLADELWPHLADRCVVYDAVLGLMNDPQRVLTKVEYVALTANNSSTRGERRRLQDPKVEAYLHEHFEVVHNQAASEQVTLLGAPVRSPAKGFGPVVLKRRSSSLAGTFTRAPM
jgi:hypothetical protein